MKIFFTVCGAAAAAGALALAFLHIKTLKPLRSFLLHAALGLGFMTVFNLLSSFTGLKIPVNVYSVLSGAVFGVPAVCGILILNLII